MPNSVERRIIQERRAAKSGAILVPILERLLEKECIPEDEEDFAFIDRLIRARAVPRKKGVFSPSMLGSCVRQAYFAKKKVEKRMAANPQTNGYFLKGNFIHFQWQFTCWKAHRAQMLELVGVEQRVGKSDFVGTIDALVRIQGKLYVVDFKGINVIDFQRTVKRGAPQEYRKQIVGYALLAAETLRTEIAGCLLVSESKAGPTNSLSSSPLALHETLVPIEDYEPEVRRRLKTLRFYDHKDEVPDPECVSTLHMGFAECPYSRFCHEEVLAVQKERERKAAKNNKPVKVAKPKR